MSNRCGITGRRRWRYCTLALPALLLLAGCSADPSPRATPTPTDSYCAAIADLQHYNSTLSDTVDTLSNTDSSGLLKVFHTIGDKYQAIADAAPDSASRQGWQHYASFFTSLQVSDLDSNKQITVNSATTDLLESSAQTTCGIDVTELLATD